jgi:hypothetical protein
VSEDNPAPPVSGRIPAEPLIGGRVGSWLRRRFGSRPPAAGKLDLRDVTLCAVDSVNVSATARALRLSMAQCDFGEAILFSHAPVAGPFRAVEIERLDSTAEYSNFLFKRLPAFVETPYALIVQWDGYVVDPAAWRPVFRKYDYIGARWPGAPRRKSVGNGGFSFNSRKFLKAMAEPRFVLDENINSDVYICRTLRPVLERDYGIRFATPRIADSFSYENFEPKEPSFGFHGMGNMWRHVDDAEMIGLIAELSPYVLRTGHCAQLIMEYFNQRRLEPLAAIYARIRAEMGSDGARQLIERYERNRALASDCIDFCEELQRSQARS